MQNSSSPQPPDLMVRFPSFAYPALVIAALGLLPTSTGRAALLIYEGFNGYTPSTALQGQAVSANAVGLKNSYTQLGQPGVTASTVVLPFSDLVITGGSIVGTSSQASGVGVSIGNVGVVSGTIYSSYLFQRTTGLEATGSSQLRINDSAGGGTGNMYYFSAAQQAVAKDSPSMVSYDPTITGASTAFTEGPLAAGVTYIVVSEFTNVGTTSGNATMWIMTAAQFDNFKSGGFTAAELNSASLGSLSTEITARAFENSVSLAAGKGFAENDGMQINLTAGNTGTNNFYRMDEIRWGTTLDDVLPVIPESSAAALLGLAGLGFLGRRRRLKG